MRLVLVLLVGCTSSHAASSALRVPVPRHRQHDSDTKVEPTHPGGPCPFAGDWTAAAFCISDDSEIAIEMVGSATAYVTGTSELCRVAFGATTAATKSSEE